MDTTDNLIAARLAEARQREAAAAIILAKRGTPTARRRMSRAMRRMAALLADAERHAVQPNGRP